MFMLCRLLLQKREQPEWAAAAKRSYVEDVDEEDETIEAEKKKKSKFQFQMGHAGHWRGVDLPKLQAGH